MITIYSMENCKWCVDAKTLAAEANIPFVEKKITPNDKSVIAELRTLLPNVSKVPQIFDGDRHVGGYDDFLAEVNGGVYGDK